MVGSYDPSSGDKADFLAIAHQHAPEKPIDAPIKLSATFTFARPKSHYRTNGEVKPNSSQYHTSRPDADNLCKFVLDALNGVFWRDDSLIYRVDAVKCYGDTPSTQITIEV